MNNLTTPKPYIIRAYYEWMIDNNLTPHILVDITMEGVEFPQQYGKNGKIIFNLIGTAVDSLLIENDYITFNARFNSIKHYIAIPIYSVESIYSKELGKGMFFNKEDEEYYAKQTNETPTKKKTLHLTTNNVGKNSTTTNINPHIRKKPHLTIVK